MSRTNHYRICKDCAEVPCWRHERPWSTYSHKPIREILGRRNWNRKNRFERAPKSYLNGPPRWWWKEQHARARRIYRQMMQRSDDPALPRERDLIDLWGWY